MYAYNGNVNETFRSTQANRSSCPTAANCSQTVRPDIGGITCPLPADGAARAGPTERSADHRAVIRGQSPGGTPSRGDLVQRVEPVSQPAGGEGAAGAEGRQS